MPCQSTAKRDHCNVNLGTRSTVLGTIYVRSPMMTLRNMRDIGVRSLAVTCGALWCHHKAVLDVEAFADEAEPCEEF